MNRNKLKGLRLELLDISRPGMFDAQAAFCCDNCGQAIVNTATVQDETGKKYTIGLDCKKNLIDKPVIEKMMGGDFMEQFKAKEYKAQVSHVQKFLKLIDDQSNQVSCSFGTIDIYDNKPHKQFPDELTGNLVYCENVGYLYKIGLKNLIQDLYRTGRITGSIPL